MHTINRNQLPFPNHYIAIDGKLMDDLGVKLMDQEDIMSWLDIHKKENLLFINGAQEIYFRHLSYDNVKKYIPDSGSLTNKDFSYLSSATNSYKALIISIQYYWEISRQIDPCNGSGTEQYLKFTDRYSKLYINIKEHLSILGLHEAKELLHRTNYYGVVSILNLCKYLKLECPKEFIEYVDKKIK